MTTQRPATVMIAAVLLALFSLIGVVSVFVPSFSEGVPAVVVYGGAALGVLGLAGAYGLWTLRRWGVWISVILSVLNALSAAPGIAFAPTTVLFIGALVSVAVCILIIVLAVMPISRRAYTQQRA